LHGSKRPFGPPPFRWTGAHPMLVKDEIRALSP
jgi:hypothetical protein